MCIILKERIWFSSDFLSRQKTDDSKPHEIIPTSFTLKSLSCEHFYQLTT